MSFDSSIIRDVTAIAYLTIILHGLLVTSQDPCEVNLQQGSVLGETIRFIYSGEPVINVTLDVFTGIPYAQSPIGSNRFGKPIPKDNWESPWNATYMRPICWQVPEVDRFIPPQSEDCLYLNIWSPSVHRSNIPVMVWIHGGAFAVGSSRPLIYDGRPLSAFNDVIVVSIQYRLNGYGFLTTGDEVLPGNYGLWDQQLALKWIKENIFAFGGDPERITIFGQSAGGASVGFHLTQPSSWGYFNNAIMMSGSMLNPGGIQLDIAAAIDAAYMIGRRAGCGSAYTSEELADCLRKVDETRLTLAIDTALTKFEPIVDGDFIPNAPQSLVKEDHFKSVPIMLGSTLNDGALATVIRYPDQIFKLRPTSDREDFRGRLRGAFPFANELIIDAIEHQYVDWSKVDDPNANYFFTYMDIESDETFLCTQEIVAREYHVSGNEVYRYLFTVEPSSSPWPPLPVWKGVAHGDDIGFVFGSAFLPEFENLDVTRNEKDLSLSMMRYFSNFAKTGNPNYDGDNVTVESIWKTYRIPEEIFKEFRPGLPDIEAYRSSFCSFWNRILPDLVTHKDAMPEAESIWREDFMKWKYRTMKEWRESFSTLGYYKDEDLCD